MYFSVKCDFYAIILKKPINRLDFFLGDKKSRRFFGCGSPAQYRAPDPEQTTPTLRFAVAQITYTPVRKFLQKFESMTTKSAKEIKEQLRHGHKLSIGEARVLELDYCKDHIDYFIDKYGHIEDKSADELIQPFKLWPAQTDALHSIMDHKWNIILKARQLGFSWLVMHIAAHLMITGYGKLVIGLSKTEEEAKELVRRLTVIFRYMPELIAEKDNVPEGWDGPIFNSTALTLTITFPNNMESNFKALASSPGAGRSFTANLLIFDEWAFQQFAREIWEGGFPTINRKNGGKVIGLSTIQRGSLFEEIYTDPDNGFNKIFIPWYADPTRDEEWYEATKRALGDGITAEYPATVDEALQVPGGAFFPYVKRETHETKEELTGPLRRYCAIDYGLDSLAAIWVQVDTKGNEQVYRTLREKDLRASEAAKILLSRSSYEHIDMWLAPSDLWSRNRDTGKTTAEIFYEEGIPLVKVSRDKVNGCVQMKEHLYAREGEKPRLTFLYGTSDELIKHLEKIQKDKRKTSVYAEEPHELTHYPDALRYFCTWWVSPAAEGEKARLGKKWTADMLEDWDNANAELREMMRELYGEPVR